MRPRSPRSEGDQAAAFDGWQRRFGGWRGSNRGMAKWRLNIKTSAQDGFDPPNSALTRSWLEFGWLVEDENDHPPKDFDHYLKLGQAQYADNGTMRRPHLISIPIAK